MLSASECKSDKEQLCIILTKNMERGGFVQKPGRHLVRYRSARPEPPVGQVDLICPLETAKGKGSSVSLPGTGLGQVMGRHQLDRLRVILQEEKP